MTPPPTPPPPDAVLPPVRSVFRELAHTIVPESAALTEDDWAEVEAIIEDALRTRPPAMRRQLRLLIRLLDWMPVVRYGRRFRSLSSPKKRRFLESIQRAPLLLLRRGFWGLRTLVFMGYYARPAAAGEIGYRAHPGGWKEVG